MITQKEQNPNFIPAKEGDRLNPLKIIFCLPGNTFSDNFLKSWSELLYSLPFHNIIPIISQKYSPVIYWARNLCLGGNVLHGIKQKPFDGKLDYDYIMWIDSDMVFKADNFYQLLSHTQYPIMSAMYPIDTENYSAVLKWDETKFLEQGYFEFIKKSNINLLKQQHPTFPLIPVSYNGFGFTLIKKGVIESIDYPWFEPIFKTMLTKDGLIRDFTGEDVSFCLKVKEKGFDMWVDTSINIGHVKTNILI
jgi:hypothetical protein